MSANTVGRFSLAWACGVCPWLLWPPPASGGDACGASIEIDPTPNPPNTTVNHLLDIEVLAPDDIWAVGLARDPATFEQFTLTLHYDGSAWTIVPSPTPPNAVGEHGGRLEDVHALASDDVYAAGRRTVNVNDAIGMALRWDGAEWRVLQELEDFGAFIVVIYEAVETVDGQNVWFGGQGFLPGQRPVAVMVRYDGSNATLYQLPREPSVVNGAHRIRGISALGPNDIWAAGAAGGVNVATGRNIVYHWDGSGWTLVPTPQLGFDEILRDVVALGPDDVWVAGSYRTSSGTFPLYLHWDGSDWTVHSASVFSADLFAFGPDDIYGVNGDTLAHWDGTAWTQSAQVRPPAVLWGIDAVGPCDLVMAGFDQFSLADAPTLIARYRATAPPGDIDGDGDVDLIDLSLLLGAFGTCSGDAGFNPNADFDGSGCVDLVDLSALLEHFGT